VSDRHEQARQFREQGWSYKRIGQEFGVVGSTVWVWLNPDRHQAQPSIKDWAERYNKRYGERRRRQSREHYDRLTWFERNEQQLKDRRRHALKRMEGRNQERAI
jgi:hypothetical protein